MWPFSNGSMMLKALHQAVAGLTLSLTTVHLQVLRDGISRYLPEANGRMLKAVACMFTNSPDSRFIIDKHPLHHQVTYSVCEDLWLCMGDDVGVNSLYSRVHYHEKASLLKRTEEL